MQYQPSRQTNVTAEHLMQDAREDALKTYQQSLTVIEGSKKMREAAVTAIEILEKHGFEVSWYQGDSHFWINVFLQEQAVKDTEVVFAELADLGYEPKRSHDSAWNSGASRAFVFDFPERDDAYARIHQMQIDVVIKPENPTCRSVQVGVETKHVPVYELRCD